VSASPIVIVRGTGSAGMRHLRVLTERLHVRAAAFPARHERIAELRAAGFDVIPSLDAVPSEPSLHAIVATNTGRHALDAIELLTWGDVLVEKPLAASIGELRALEDACTAHGHSVYVAYCLRFDAGLRAARECLEGGGAISSVRIEAQSYLPDWRPARDHRAAYSASAHEGGVLRDLSHELDYAVWLFGRPTAVCCRTENTGVLGIDAEERADLAWTAPGGARVSIRLDYLTRVPRRRLSVTGERVTVEWDAIAGTVTSCPNGGRPTVTSAPFDADTAFAVQDCAFISGRGAESLATLDEGQFIVRLIDAAHRSSQCGGVPVSVEATQ
jgi:predicted dehydrogenase